jgi:hypothetical protein
MFICKGSLEDIDESTEVGFLYIFDASHYDNNLTICLENTVKLGMTRRTIKSRLNQYKIKPKNISYINCSEPSKRERILKNYIKEKLNIKATCGSEYFKGCRKELEDIILYFALCDLSTINKYYEIYKDIEEKKKWFDNILIDELPLPVSYKNKSMETSAFICMFCNSTFSLKKTLDVHVKTKKNVSPIGLK